MLNPLVTSIVMQLTAINHTKKRRSHHDVRLHATKGIAIYLAQLVIRSLPSCKDSLQGSAILLVMINCKLEL